MRRGVALVTGASGSFGVHSCAALVARGFRVFATMRDLDKSEAVAKAIAARGFDPDERSNVEFMALDILDPEAVEAALARILDDRELGYVDVLVNNAGVMTAGFAEEVEEAELRHQFEVNFFALVRLTQALIAPMRERRHGRIINISSAGGRFATPSFAAYHASKFALEGWSEALRHELRPFFVFVSLVEPGLYPTGIWGRNLRRVGPGVTGKGPYGRLGRRIEAEGQRARERLAAWAKPEAVGEAVAKVALADRPRLRYPVGVDAWGAALSGPTLLGLMWEQTMLQWFKDPSK